jgi:group I intron endonuclease
MRGGIQMVGIYKITNLINNKNYIGQSINIQRRLGEHKYRPFNEKDDGYNTPLYKAIRKYGLENFSFDIIEECSPDQLNAKEIFWIQHYNSYIKNGKGYNLTRGGDGRLSILHDEILNLWDEGKSITEISTILDICKSSVINHLNGYLTYNSEESKKRGYNTLKSRAKVKVYDLNLKYITTFDNPEVAAEWLGVTTDSVKNCCQHRTQRCKDFILCWEDEEPKSLTGQYQAVLQLDLKGNIIQKYSSIGYASRQTNTNKHGIIKCCKGTQKTAGGFKWKYIN